MGHEPSCLLIMANNSDTKQGLALLCLADLDTN